MYKVMLADDEGIVIDSLLFLIEKEFGSDCLVKFAKTGRSMIELAETFRPDIAIVDIQMPGINGIEAIKEIQKSNFNIIFIIMSAYDKFDYAKEAINLRVLDYINKPMDRRKMVEVMKKAMNQCDSGREKRSKELLIKEKMETVIPIIENGLIYNFLFQQSMEEIHNYKSLLGIQEDYGYMAVLVCGESQDGNNLTNAVGSSVTIQTKYNTVRELLRGYFPCIMGAVMGNKIALYIPTTTTKIDYNQRIELIDRARELVRKLKKHIDMKFRIGIGSVKKMKDMMESYQEAFHALLETTGTVVHVDDLPIGRSYEKNYPVEVEHRMFEQTEKGNVEDVITEANQFFDWMETNYGQYITDIKLKVLEFVLHSEWIAFHTGGMEYHFRQRQDYLPTLNELNDLDSIRIWFVDKITQSTRSVIQKKSEQSAGMLEQAKTYIMSHYNNKNISLDDVSREINISPYYFSKLFKEKTGENFIDYVTSIRINKAKELLKSTNLSMKEICEKIGYADPNYFSRSFKRRTGLSPTEYKEES